MGSLENDTSELLVEDEPSHRRRFFTLISQCDSMSDFCRNVKINCVGSGPYGGDCKKLATNIKIAVPDQAAKMGVKATAFWW